MEPFISLVPSQKPPGTPLPNWTLKPTVGARVDVVSCCSQVACQDGAIAFRSTVTNARKTPNFLWFGDQAGRAATDSWGS